MGEEGSHRAPWHQRRGPYLHPFLSPGFHQQGMVHALKYLIGKDTQSALLLQLWNLDGGKPLTSRVAWASSFEHIITNTFREDTPLILPNPAAD